MHWNRDLGLFVRHERQHVGRKKECWMAEEEDEMVEDLGGQDKPKS